MSDLIIDVNDVSMKFNMSREKVDNIKEYIVRLVQGRIKIDEFWALRDVSFSIKKGQSLGIVGVNGSGKSTLLKVIAGVMKPSSGTVGVYGSVAPLIELGAGFDYELTARENIFLNGAILGFSRSEMKEKFDDIMNFSELWEFIDVPIKNFSSGMVARLGFAIATISRPDILIADEILGVGDYKFQLKCEQRMNEIISNGATIILVSHAIEQIQKMCTHTAWIHKGKLMAFGPTADVSKKYMESLQ